MRAIIAERLGPPEVLELKDLPRPEPAAGEVLVELHAAGVNFAETERRRGVYATPELPWCPGAEGAGRVVAIAPDVDAALPGQRVAFWAMPPAVSSTYAELATAPVEALFHLPDSISFEVGAALPLQGLTAYGLAFRAAKIQPDMKALVHAGAGGVGQILIQLLQLQGATVFATTSTQDKARAVTALGAKALLYSPDLPSEVAAATDGGGVDLVYDSIGKATQQQSLALLAPYGQLVYFGEASGPPAPIAPDQLYDRCLKISAYGLDIGRDPGAWTTARRRLLNWLENGDLKLNVSRRFPLAQAAEAHHLLESRASTGKVVLLPQAQ